MAFGRFTVGLFAVMELEVVLKLYPVLVEVALVLNILKWSSWRAHNFSILVSFVFDSFVFDSFFNQFGNIYSSYLLTRYLFNSFSGFSSLFNKYWSTWIWSFFYGSVILNFYWSFLYSIKPLTTVSAKSHWSPTSHHKKPCVWELPLCCCSFLYHQAFP